MDLYGSVPFDEVEAVYIWNGLGAPGFFDVTVKGFAPNFTVGIQLLRDRRITEEVVLNVRGWIGLSRDQKSPYVVHGAFEEHYAPQIFIVSNGKRQIVEVRERAWSLQDA